MCGGVISRTLQWISSSNGRARGVTHCAEGVRAHAILLLPFSHLLRTLLGVAPLPVLGLSFEMRSCSPLSTVQGLVSSLPMAHVSSKALDVLSSLGREFHRSLDGYINTIMPLRIQNSHRFGVGESRWRLRADKEHADAGLHAAVIVPETREVAFHSLREKNLRKDHPPKRLDMSSSDLSRPHSGK